jgi:hypothetical protein
MPVRLLDLRHVPDDEADDVRRLLDANGIDWYETPPGLFGISAGGIWIRDGGDVAQARRLLDGYQAERRRRARAERERELREGTAETFADIVRTRPLAVLLALLAVAGLLVLMAWPFFLLR